MIGRIENNYIKENFKEMSIFDELEKLENFYYG